MARSRAFLIWLCCALVLCTGVPLRASAPCEPATSAPAAPSCCGTERCRCSEMAKACECGGSRVPEPSPQPPSPQKLQAPAPEQMPRLPQTPAMGKAKVEPAPGEAPRACAIPSRSRMEVFSIWRC